MDAAPASRIFGLSQLLVLGLILFSVLLVIFKQWLRDRMLKKMEEEQTAALGRKSSGLKPRAEAQDFKKPGFLSLTSTLPNWTGQTSAHEILGVNPDATPTQVEEAYKTLLKKVHPDRVTSFGPEYAKRAHELVLLLQKARSQLLKK